jgi:FAD/FMN-containing dehydrogenase
MTTTAQTAAFQPLTTAMRGPVIQPGDDGYDTARAVYNAMIDRRPAAIARCADVITAVRFAGDHDLTVAVRGGGHNAGGLGVWDDALVIDLSAMRGIRVDPGSKTVIAQGGCVWGDVDHATGAFGLAVPSGILASTGVAGLTLGGGTGYLTCSGRCAAAAVTSAW